jgi:hypothetical protein
MKTIVIILNIFLLTICTLGQERVGSSFRSQSYYGFSGLTFIPTAQVTPAGQLDISYSSKPVAGKDLNLVPFSVRIGYGPQVKGVELAITNTPLYSSRRDLDGVSIKHGLSNAELVVPFFPSVKYQLMPMVRDNYNVSMAIGFAYPYGGYYVVDKFFDVSYFDITVHTGVATKLTTYHVFSGFTFTFGDRLDETQRNFGLEMLIEAGWGGSLKQLDQKEESFVSLSFRQAWTSALFITTFFRLDNQSLMKDGEKLGESPTLRMGVGLDYRLSKI